MSTLKTVMRSAATYVVIGGLGLGAAIWSAMQDESYTCVEYCDDTTGLRDKQTHREFYLGVTPGIFPDAATTADNGWVIGNCAAGYCEVTPDNCTHCGFDWTYEAGPLVNGKRVIKVFAPLVTAGGLKAWADDTAGAKFLWGAKKAITTCLANYPKADCRDMFEPLVKLKLDNGYFCEAGMLKGPWQQGAGPGKGGDELCPYDDIFGDTPTINVIGTFPFVINRAAGSELSDSVKDWTAGELDL
jgi:hypothetical protein